MIRIFFYPVVILLLAVLAGRGAGREVPIGSHIGHLTFKDIRYLSRSLDDFPGRKAFVLVFTSTDCPLVSRYLPVLNRLEKEYGPRGVQFLAVNVGAEDSIVGMAAQAVEHDAVFPFVKDFDLKWVDALGVQRTPEVAILDGERRLRYRGRIDDRYRPGGARKEPTRHDLAEALNDLLAGRPVQVPVTPVDGCLITRVDLPRPELPLTFAEHIEPVLRKHCQECHRPGTAAPFALQTFEKVRARGRMIAEVVKEGRMPPWFAAPAHGTFLNKRGLTPRERDLVRQWVRGGMLPGELGKLLPPELPPQGRWRIGEPDLVLDTAPFDLPAEGDVPYKYVVLPHLFTAETWVQGVQILPDNGRVVHHCNLAYVTLGESFKTSNFIAGLVPGNGPMQLDDRIAYRIPGGSLLALQIHFVTTGKAEKCQLRVGLRYARGQVDKQLRHVLLVDKGYSIQPGAAAHPVRASQVLDRDALCLGLFIHMHVRGKAMTFRAHLPDGQTETLLLVPNYNFDWQTPYRWQPGQKRLPKGTRLECVALYDNSAFNPYNPNPKATVRDGPQTYHEMMNGFIFYVDQREDLNLTIDPRTGRARQD